MFQWIYVEFNSNKFVEKLGSGASGVCGSSAVRWWQRRNIPSIDDLSSCRVFVQKRSGAAAWTQEVVIDVRQKSHRQPIIFSFSVRLSFLFDSGNYFPISSNVVRESRRFVSLPAPWNDILRLNWSLHSFNGRWGPLITSRPAQQTHSFADFNLQMMNCLTNLDWTTWKQSSRSFQNSWSTSTQI